MTTSLDRELEVALQAARDGGDRLVAEAARPGGPRGSGSHADVDSEIGEAVARAILAAFPDDSVEIEEPYAARRRGRSGRAWVIDPHDGTRDFLLGARETSVSIGLAAAGRLLLGVVHAPFSTPLTPGGLLTAWAEGHPITRDGAPVEVTVPSPIPFGPGLEILVGRSVHGPRADRLRALLSPATLVPCASVATRFARVALGLSPAALTVGNPLADWDFAGAQAILQAAGGDVFDASGLPVAWKGIRSAPHDMRAYVAARDPSLAAEIARRCIGR